MAAHYTTEEMMELDPILLRMHLRERVHHTLEHQLYLTIYGERSAGTHLGATARKILDVWEARGLPTELPDIQWIYQLLDLTERVKNGEEIQEIPGAFAPSPFSEWVNAG